MNTSKATRQQIACISAMINKLGLSEAKDELVYSFSHDRTTSRSELTSDEAKALIAHLKRQDPDEKKAEIMRRKIIAYCHQMKRYIPGTHRVDMKWLDGWCEKYSYLHKRLDKYQYHELPALVSQFENVFASYLTAL